MSSSNSRLVTVVIPHHSGDVLLSCLRSLYAHTPTSIVDVVVVDDSIHPDGSIEKARAVYPHIRVLKTSGETGYGASCNFGLRNAREAYAVLLNNDAEVSSGWLEPLLAAMEAEPRLAFCQPKILSLRNRRVFDVGGAGGLLDWFCYPFAFGHMVHAAEQDNGQYDEPRPLFWAHGAAMMVRLSVLAEIGFFDEEFEMQAEEIDLCSRALLRGYDIRSVPSSVVYHYFGWTFKTNTVKRFYLSHRNTIVMMLKNWPMRWLVWTFPVRLSFELLGVVYGVCRLNWRQPVGIVMALTWIFFHPGNLIRRRKALRHETDNLTLVTERIYKGSILWAYFIRRIRASGLLSKTT